MADPFPIWAIVVDYVLGMVMWTLIGRFGMNIFLPENSNFFFMKFFVRVTNPLLKAFFDLLPQAALRGSVSLLAATGAAPSHYLALDTGLRTLVASLEGWSAPTVVYAVSADFEADGNPVDALRQKIGVGLAELAQVSR